MFSTCFQRYHYGQSVIREWNLLVYEKPTADTDQILAQYLTLNSNIRLRNQPIMNNCFDSQGIQQVGDIFCIQEKRFYTYQEIVESYGPCGNYLLYYSLIAAIPKDWVITLKRKVLSKRNIYDARINT